MNNQDGAQEGHSVYGCWTSKCFSFRGAGQKYDMREKHRQDEAKIQRFKKQIYNSDSNGQNLKASKFLR